MRHRLRDGKKSNSDIAITSTADGAITAWKFRMQLIVSVPWSQMETLRIFLTFTVLEVQIVQCFTHNGSFSVRC